MYIYSCLGFQFDVTIANKVEHSVKRFKKYKQVSDNRMLRGRENNWPYLYGPEDKWLTR